MSRTFNCGIGLVLVVAAGQENSVTQALQKAGENNVWTVGKITKHGKYEEQCLRSSSVNKCRYTVLEWLIKRVLQAIRT